MGFLFRACQPSPHSRLTMNDCSRLLVLAALAVSTVLSSCGDSSESVATTTSPPPSAEEQCWGKLSDVVFDYFNTRDADPLIDIAGSENGVLI